MWVIHFMLMHESFHRWSKMDSWIMFEVYELLNVRNTRAFKRSIDFSVLILDSSQRLIASRNLIKTAHADEHRINKNQHSHVLVFIRNCCMYTEGVAGTEWIRASCFCTCSVTFLCLQFLQAVSDFLSAIPTRLAWYEHRRRLISPSSYLIRSAMRLLGRFAMHWRGSQRKQIRRAKLTSATFKDYLRLRLRCR